MNLEEKVCSLELAKKLKELNIEQSSLFVWEYYDDQCHGVKFIPYAVVPHETNNCKLYSAFTASEVISLLPQRITLKEDEPFNSFTLYIKKSFVVVDGNTDNLIPTYIINYECDSTAVTGEDAFLRRQLFPHNIWDDNFSNALAKTLIYLIENKLVMKT